MSLNREAILSTGPRLRVEPLEVPEWGGPEVVRELTGQERDTFESSMLDMESGKPELRMVGTRAMLAALSCVDEQGQRLFTEEDLPALRSLSGAALSRVFEVASRLSGLTSGSMEELAGNLPAGPSAGNGSSLPSPSA